jgi:hypothetical protein
MVCLPPPPEPRQTPANYPGHPERHGHCRSDPARATLWPFGPGEGLQKDALRQSGLVREAARNRWLFKFSFAGGRWERPTGMPYR